MPFRSPLIDLDAAAANRRRLHGLRAKEQGGTVWLGGRQKDGRGVHRPRRGRQQ